jgi:hypothetical protein
MNNLVRINMHKFFAKIRYRLNKRIVNMYLYFIRLLDTCSLFIIPK